MKKLLLLTLLVSAFCVVNAREGWRIRANQLPDRYFGATMANGILGVVSSAEPMKPANVILANVYDIYGRGDVSNFLNGYNVLDFTMSVDGQTVDKTSVSDHRQELRMDEAVFVGNYAMADKIEVEYSMLALRHLPHTALMRVTIKAKRPVNISGEVTLSVPQVFRDHRFDYTSVEGIPLLSSTAKTPTGRLDLSATTSLIFKESKIATVRKAISSTSEALEFDHAMKVGEELEFYVVGSTISNERHADPRNEAKRLNVYAVLQGYDRLMERHRAEWNELWQSDIVIDGDPQSQLWVRSMLYNLYASVREGSSLSIAPMGLSGLGYNGHIFWDADVWMFPVLLALRPELAESMIEYRFQRLEAAKYNAFIHGYKGAMYPWESSDFGCEDTPVYALTGPFEHHVTACVGIAAYDYYAATGDRRWLEEKGFPMLRETADFWVSRATKNGRGGYDILNVVCADEYAENVNNNAFTNAAARLNLERAAKTARLLGQPVNPKWDEVAAGLPIPTFENGVIREHDTYNGEVIKQADVNLLAYPLGVVTDPKQIRRDLEYYEPKVDKDGPAMTHSIFSILYARLGDTKRAYELFERSYKPNMIMPFGVIAECAGGSNPYFVTGAGGTLQSVIMGFGGIAITDEGVRKVYDGALPRHWKSLTIKGVGRDKQSYIIK